MRSIFLTVLILSFFQLMAQPTWLLTSSEMMPIYEADFIMNDTVHTSIRPFTYSDLGELSASTHDTFTPPGKWHERLWKTDLLHYDEGPFEITVNPAVNLGLGWDFTEDWGYTYTNTRGVFAHGKIGEKFGFYTGFYENQALYNRYVWDAYKGKRVLPAFGLKRGFYGNAWDYYWAHGMMQYKPTHYLELFAGHGRNFIGEGHRSLLLSDNAFNYFHFGAALKFKHFKYVVIHPFLNDLRRDLEVNGAYRKKYQAVHYLSLNLGKKLNIGLFESITYGDTSRAVNSQFEFNYLNPVIFWRAIEYSQGSQRGNAMLGLNASYKFNKQIALYGQFALDEWKLSEIRAGNGWWANKYAIQLGVKGYDVLLDGLHYRLEYNQVRPYMYAHKLELLNYGHFQQSMAHPLGANFREWIGILQYDSERWQWRAHAVYYRKGEDINGENYGSDIFESYDTRVQDYGNEIGQGGLKEVLFVDLSSAYMVNPKWMTQLKVGVILRSESRAYDAGFTGGTRAMPYIALRHQLFNQYLDF